MSVKQRLLVMNGRCIVEQEADGKWRTERVDAAGALKPGIYNLYTAKAPEPDKTYDGVILYADKQHVYQQVGKTYVSHDRENFDKVPVIGSAKSIRYAEGRAVMQDAATHARGLSR